MQEEELAPPPLSPRISLSLPAGATLTHASTASSTDEPTGLSAIAAMLSPRAARAMQSLFHRTADTSNTSAVQQRRLSMAQRRASVIVAAASAANSARTSLSVPAQQKTNATPLVRMALYVPEVIVATRKFFVTNTATRVKACKELGLIAWNGDEGLHSHIAEDANLLNGVLEAISDLEVEMQLRSQAIQTLSVLVRTSRTVQEKLVELNVCQILAEVIIDDTPFMRQWAIHSLCFLCIHLPDVRTAVREQPVLMEGLTLSSREDDWSAWTTNDADEIIKVLDHLK